MGSFFRQRGGARIRDHDSMMMGGANSVNGRQLHRSMLHDPTPIAQKKSRAHESPA
jgi:hypothetical protein